MRSAQQLLLCLLAAAGVWAQDVDIETLVDADYRVYDLVKLKTNPKAFECTVIDKGDRVTIQRKGRSGSVTIERAEIEKITPRQTPLSAYEERAKLVAETARGDLHRRLAEWCLQQSLQQQAEVELGKAAEAASAPLEANLHRERLVGLLEARAWVQSPTEPKLLEQILRLAEAAEQSGSPSARLQLARARVALELGLDSSAREILGSCCTLLQAAAAAPAAADEPFPVELDPEAPRERFRDRCGLPFVPPLSEDDGEEEDGEDEQEPPAPEDATTLTGLTRAQQTLFRVAHTLLGEQLLRAQHVEEAGEAFQAVLDAWTSDPRAAAGKARALAAQGELEQAAGLLRTALGPNPNDRDLLLVQGQIDYLQGNAKRAVSTLEKAVAQAGPEGTLAYRWARTALGLAQVLAGQLTDADAAFLAADSDPGFAPARLGRGLVAEFQGDPDAARTHYQEATRLDPSHGEAHYALAHAQLEAGQLEAAEASLRAALEAGYVLELGVSSLVEVAWAREDADAATRLLELLYRVEERPGPRLLSALGNAYLGQGRVQDAEGLFRKALEQDASHVPSLRGLAYCAYSQEQLAEARQLFERLLADERVDPWASAGIAALERQASRRVWSDGFSGGALQTLWKRDVDYGLQITPEDDHVVFKGSQQNDAQGITSLMRRVEGEQVVQVEATLELPAGGYRAGVRFEGERGGVVVFRDFDGVIRYALGARRGDWKDPVELGTWPASGAHRLAIDLQDPSRGGVVFRLDGKALNDTPVEVQGLRFSGKRKQGQQPSVQVGIYGRGQALGQRVEFRCDQVEVFVERVTEDGPKRPKRY